MCITFFYANPHASRDEYRLIIIANRDEFYHRKSAAAHRWKENRSIIGGRDLESLSRGTWLAASEKGKIGILLNIDIQIPSPKAVSRGVLISNFLKEDVSALEFCETLTENQRSYNGFHLLLFDISSNDVKMYVQTNAKNVMSKPKELDKGYHGYSNSVNLPYNKVVWGKEQFEKIVNLYNSTSHREILVNELLKLAKSQKKHYPDDILLESKRLVMDEHLIEKLSSIFVSIPEKKYGTRTHSIILVSQDNYMDFNEYTMEEPINLDDHDWSYSHFLVKLKN